MTTTCTSSPCSGRSASAISASVAPPRISWLITVVPSKARARSHSATQLPAIAPGSSPNFSWLPRTSTAAWNIPPGLRNG